MNVLSFMMNVMNDSPIDLAETRGFVYAVARRIVRDEEDAADVTQDALLLAHRHAASFRGECSYRTWLYRIATTTALGYLRKRKRSREVLAIEPTDDPDPRPTPEQAVAAHEVEEMVRAAIAGLDDKYRDVLTLRADDLSDAEVAAQLGVSVANVKIRAFRARLQLKDVLA
jgi:RNA polymerase sigma-70 factor (ECF subfamily)